MQIKTQVYCLVCYINPRSSLTARSSCTCFPFTSRGVVAVVKSTKYFEPCNLETYPIGHATQVLCMSIMRQLEYEFKLELLLFLCRQNFKRMSKHLIWVFRQLVVLLNNLEEGRNINKIFDVESTMNQITRTSISGLTF